MIYFFRERDDLNHTVTVMADLGLTYTQIKAAEGSYVFQMEPDLDALAQFPGNCYITVSILIVNFYFILFCF